MSEKIDKAEHKKHEVEEIRSHEKHKIEQIGEEFIHTMEENNW